MTRDELLETAKVLPPFTTASAHEYSARREAIVMAINQLLLQRPDIHLMVGASNIDMMRDNHANHARFVESLLLHYNAETLVETVLWVFHAYRSHGFHLTYWPAQLNAWVEVLRHRLSPESFAVIYPLYHWFIIHIPTFAALTDSRIGQPASEA